MTSVIPQPGQGWAELIVNPKFNGGDSYPPEYSPLVDSLLGHMEAAGLLMNGTPASLFIFQPAPSGVATDIWVHWANDKRIRANDSFAFLSAYIRHAPPRRYFIFARQPLFEGLLAKHGWALVAKEEKPYMAMLVYQPQEENPR